MAAVASPVGKGRPVPAARTDRTLSQLQEAFAKGALKPGLNVVLEERPKRRNDTVSGNPGTGKSPARAAAPAPGAGCRRVGGAAGRGRAGSGALRCGRAAGVPRRPRGAARGVARSLSRASRADRSVRCCAELGSFHRTA